jgi:hypothetical protein
MEATMGMEMGYLSRMEVTMGMGMGMGYLSRMEGEVQLQAQLLIFRCKMGCQELHMEIGVQMHQQMEMGTLHPSRQNQQRTATSTLRSQHQ